MAFQKVGRCDGVDSENVNEENGDGRVEGHAQVEEFPGFERLDELFDEEFEDSDEANGTIACSLFSGSGWRAWFQR